MAAKPFSLSVVAVVFDPQNRCLLLRRSAHDRYFAGKWEWPGGKVEPGEDFATAVLRETREETSLDVEITSLAGATQFEMADVQVIILYLEARITGGNLRLSVEHDDFTWAPLPELERFDLAPIVSDFMLNYARRKELDHECKCRPAD